MTTEHKLLSKLLIVVNPTTDSQPAIDRVIKLADRGVEGYQPEIVLLFAVDHSSTDTAAGNESIYRDDAYLTELVTPLRQRGLKVSIRISWSKDWADSILQSAESVEASVIMISHPGEDVSRALSDEFWYLMRNSSVPVSIIQPNENPSLRKILVAMDLSDEKLEGLNRRIMETGKDVASVHSAELHLACAYRDSSHYPDRGRIVNLTGMPNENVHLQQGEADDALAEITAKLDPDMLIVGATRRTGIKAALRGRKISQIIGRVKHDIFMIV